MQTMGKQQRGSSADLYDISDPGPNDVLFGRGTGSNMHSGNIRFRALIQKYKPVYRDTPKKMKPSVSTKVVAIWRSQNPPGRFLTRSDRFHGSKRTFYDVGDAMARRKAAQCLREKSSKERLQLQQQKQQEAATTSAAGGEDDPVVDDDAVMDGFPDLDNPKTVTSSAEGTSSSSLVVEPLVEDKEVDNDEEKSDDDLKDDIDLEQIDVLSVVTSANLREKFGSPPSSSKPATNEPPKQEKKISDSMSSSKLVPNLKKALSSSNTYNVLSSATKKQDTDAAAAWFSCGSPKSADSSSFSLVNTYETNLTSDTEVDNRESDSPFLFASFDFESSAKNNKPTSNDSGNDEDGGLCFPSLFGGSGESSSSSLFDDDNEDTNKKTNESSFLSNNSSSSGMAFPSLFGGCGSAAPSFPFEEPTTGSSAQAEPPVFFPASLPDPSVKQETLQTIRDRMPTAAALTTMDW